MAISTTGQDVAGETREFNDRLAGTLAPTPKVYEVDDPVALRARSAVFPAPVIRDEGSDRVIPGRGGGVPVRVFTPPTVNGVYLHFHPGGWVLGSARNQDGRLWDLAQAAEVAVVSVDYRLAPEHPHPAAADDCEDAARWLAANAEREFGTSQLVIGGESAGATLSVCTMLRLRDGQMRHGQMRDGQMRAGRLRAGQTGEQEAGDDAPDPAFRAPTSHTARTTCR